MKQILGKLETQFFAYVQMRNLVIVRADEMQRALGLTNAQTLELFRRLTKGRLIARVRPGLYLVPSRLPLGGAWTPSEIAALNALISRDGGQYQICGPNAFNRYGFDNQIPNRTYAYNDRISGERRVGSVLLTLIEVSRERLGSVEEVKTPEGEIGFYSSRVRTLVDAVYDWSRFNTLPRAYSWIENELKAKRVKAADLVKVSISYGDIATIRRVGFFLTRIGIRKSVLSGLIGAIRPTTSFIPLYPNKAQRGVINRRWGILDNGDW